MTFLETFEGVTFYSSDRLRIADVHRRGGAYTVGKLEACMTGVAHTRVWPDGDEPEYGLPEALAVAQRWVERTPDAP